MTEEPLFVANEPFFDYVNNLQRLPLQDEGSSNNNTSVDVIKVTIISKMLSQFCCNKFLIISSGASPVYQLADTYVALDDLTHELITEFIDVELSTGRADCGLASILTTNNSYITVRTSSIVTRIVTCSHACLLL